MTDTTLIGVYGESNSGKTHLITQLVEYYTKQGRSIATIKKSDKHILLDTHGKDTWKHAKAGASCVVLSSAHNTDIMVQASLDVLTIVQIVSVYHQYDLWIIEGAQQSTIPKIKTGAGPTRSHTVLELSLIHI